MKLIPRHFSLACSVLLAATLAGCATDAHHSDSHPPAGMAMADMQTMCEKHKKMMSGKSAAEQRTMMHEDMKSMTPEMRQRMQAMQEHCK